MTILFLSYWGIQEGLSQATVLPHVSILADNSHVKKVILLTIERGTFSTPLLPANVIHIPLISIKKENVFMTKFGDFVEFPKSIKKICQDHHVNFLLCRSSMAGALGYLVWRKIHIPYAVESFEPHAEYMAEAGVWKRWDPRYWLQKYFEWAQTKTASWLLPVAATYTKALQAQGVTPSKLITMPCCLNIRDFELSIDDREKQRQQLGIEKQAVVGIYVGKFGGIYYEKEAFQLLKRVQDFFGGSFHLIVLTNDDAEKLKKEFKESGMSNNSIHLANVQRHEVPAYLSASDFAFTFYKKSPSMQYLSPIKIGEYWANGLPVLIEEGIGDDAKIVQEEGGGFIFDIKKQTLDFGTLQKFLNRGRDLTAKEITQIAMKHRDIAFVKNAYNKIISDLVPMSYRLRL